METSSCFAVPDFGAVIARQHPIRVFRGQRPGLTLICAPAGYGKSVLASQIVQYGDFDRAVWVSGFDEDMQGETLLAYVHRALLPCSTDSDRPIETFALDLQRDDLFLAVGDALRGHHGATLCLVIDGCNEISDLESLARLTRLVRTCTSPCSCLVVTCRRIENSQSLDPAQVLNVEEQDLRFTEEEVAHLQALIGSEGADDSPAHLRSRFGGHPALTALMLRHVCLDAEVAPPRDLVWYVDRLAAGLSQEALQLAYIASLLVEGDFSSLAACTSTEFSAGPLSELLSLSPLLVTAPESAQGSRRFIVHAVLRDAIRRRAQRELGQEMMSESLDAAMLHLEKTRGYVRLQAVLQADCSSEVVAEWMERCGEMILRFAGAGVTLRLLDRVDPSILAVSPQLLLLRATALREQEELVEAQTNAILAASIADSVNDRKRWVAGMLLAARLAMDVSDFQLARKTLLYLEGNLMSPQDANAERMLHAYLSVVELHQGQIREALERSDRASRALDSIRDLGSSDSALTVNCLAGVQALGAGRWSVAARYLTALANREDISVGNRVTVKANLAACQVELGYLSEATELLSEVIEQTEAAALRQLAAGAYGTRAAARHAAGDTEGAMLDHAKSEGLLGLGHDELPLLGELITSAVTRRATGRYEEALSQCEKASLLVSALSPTVKLYEIMVSLETAASLLSLSDNWGARRCAQEVARSLEGSGAMGHLLRADLILAEADRLEGDIDGAISRLAGHADYISTGSANWLSAMYARAFPGLLGILTQAIGADALPLRMLLMVPLETLDEALQLATYLSEEEQRILQQRRGAEAVSRELTEPESAAQTSTYSCYARLFGGLEVATEVGVVNEDDWRKRKARLLFLALLLKQHQDVPRDVLLERFWPDMDEVHAKRNFYVTWSTMKRALSCGGRPADAKPFVQCSGGVCRATRLVRSDLDDFDETLSLMRASAATNDVDAVLACARRLVDLYRGELLPGDLYEEWFAEARDRTKHDFCDAMMVAATAAESRQESETALLFLRKASAADPWREDVYQSMMRCQMNAGQRSRAIETYLSCRSRLTEDLGIDPSVETTRIYQAVLAMEDAPLDDV